MRHLLAFNRSTLANVKSLSSIFAAIRKDVRATKYKRQNRIV